MAYAESTKRLIAAVQAAGFARKQFYARLNNDGEPFAAFVSARDGGPTLDEIRTKELDLIRAGVVVQRHVHGEKTSFYHFFLGQPESKHHQARLVILDLDRTGEAFTSGGWITEIKLADLEAQVAA